MRRRNFTVDPDFRRTLRELRAARGMSLRDLKIISPSYAQELESGRKQPTPEIARVLDVLLDGHGKLARMVRVNDDQIDLRELGTAGVDEIEALEISRRVAASDVGEETLRRLEAVVDELATKYSVTPPEELLERCRRYLGYTVGLLDGKSRKTLAEHRRLVEISGWLSLLAATLHIDLRQSPAGTARLATAATLANHADQREILAWTFETRAWSAVTDGDYAGAVALARTARQIAPLGGSAAIQAAAQEGRAWARLGQAKETYAALDRVARLTENLARPERPEHHYRYDPDKGVAYVATTLAWLGDPAAETYAREVIARLRASEDAGGWPRRVASARLDLARALLAAGKLEEAAAEAQTAILSGRVVPSNHWRATEIVDAVEARGVAGAADLRETYELMVRG